MKTLATILSVSLLAASSAWGAILVKETFSHPAGNLVGTTPEVGSSWDAHSGKNNVPVKVSGGSITLAQGDGSREDVNVNTGTTMVAGDKWYAAFDLTVPFISSVNDTYFAMFLSGTSSFDARVWITAPYGPIGYRLAMSNDNEITSGNGEVRTNDLAFGTTYRIVTMYDYSAQAGKLWINPTTESDPSFAPTDPGTSYSITSYAFRQAAGNTTQIIDNLVVATTFAEAVPEPATIGLLLLGLPLLRRSRRR